MLTAADIDIALRQHLPADLHSAIPSLAQILAQASTGAVSTAEAQARLATSPGLADALRALSGRHVQSHDSLISFGSDNQMGDVTISGDVAGRDVIKLHVNLGVQQTITGGVGSTITGNIQIGSQTNNYYSYATPVRSLQEQRNRRAMLTKVRKIWVEGLLERSLTDELRIDLNLVDRPDAVHLPLNAVVQELEQPPRVLPLGVPISEVFNQVGSELLILGAPGAGKTTLLLELLRDLLQRAENDEAYPLPVVFPLSTWGAERKPLKAWLVDQLNVIYDVPRKLGQGWVAENDILPLLDGLDEVAAEHRDACVEAINKYRQEVGGLAPTAIASRMVDYEALKGKLRLRGAVLVEPLTRQQVVAYLSRVGEPLRGVSKLVQADQEVMELLDSPLMLSVSSLAFRNTSLEILTKEGALGERKARLWYSYTERMLGRKSIETRYHRQQTSKRLVWLARKIVEHKQTVFYIEQLQPSWLHRWSRLGFTTRVGLLSFLIGGAIGGVVGGLVGGLVEGLSRGSLEAWQVGSSSELLLARSWD